MTRISRFFPACGGLCAALLLTGCSGHNVSLDDTPALTVTDVGPGSELILERRDDSITDRLVVDSERLYWVDYDSSVQSCLKNDCVHTVLTYARGSSKYAVEVAVGGEHLYWATNDGTIYTCARSGCVGAPVRVFQDPDYDSGGPSDQLKADDDYVYWPTSDGELFRCPATGCGSIPERVTSVGNLEFPIISGDSAYFTTFNSGIERVPKDGSAPATSIKALIPNSQVPSYGFLVAVQDTELFWTDSNFQVWSCSSADCPNTTQLVLPNLAALPRGYFNVSHGWLYWQDDPAHFSPISGCKLADCATGASVQIIPTGTFMWVLDDESVYWLDESVAAVGMALFRTALPAR